MNIDTIRQRLAPDLANTRRSEEFADCTRSMSKDHVSETWESDCTKQAILGIRNTRHSG